MARISRTRLEGDEGGFTLLEIVIAMTIISTSFVTLAHSLAGGMAALSAARQRSVFVELANAEVENLRALHWESLGVSTTDPDRATAYPSDLHDGHSAVLLDVPALQAADPSLPAPPAAVSVVTTSPVSGVITPYTIRRWITWSDAGGPDSVTQLKRIQITLEWDESGRGDRSVSLESIRYPGGLGQVDGSNQAPIAQASAAPLVVQAFQSISFTGSTSSDPDGDLLTHAWQFGDGATSTAADPTHAYTVPGTYDAVHTVTDPGGLTSSVSVNVTVNALVGLNQPPTASFTATPTVGVAPLSVNFDASGSSDPESSSLTYTWFYGDGMPDGAGVSATHVFSSVGTFTVTLRVTDDAGLWDDATIDITTTPLNCTITSASFKNPSSNTTTNDILVDSSNKPTSNGFMFTATTNSACTNVSAVLPLSAGTLTVTLNYSEASGVRTWTGATSLGSSVRFNRANDQSGSFTASGGATFPITFDVHG
ncbi:MAG TPA: PKD domain-containing protein [Acidimicrobiales bacterium]|nr:PKD domain-containing protein [Acidimicrobiales bacterium]